VLFCGSRMERVILMGILMEIQKSGFVLVNRIIMLVYVYLLRVKFM